MSRSLQNQRLLSALLLLAIAGSAVLFSQLRTRDGRRRPAATEAAAELVERSVPSLPSPETAAEEVDSRTELPPRPADDGAGPEETPEESFDASAVYGTVVEENGQAIAGALVLLFSDRRNLREQQAPLAERTSDETGRFRFRDRRPHEPCSVLLQAEGFLPAIQQAFPGRDQVIELEPAVSIRGRILSLATGEPLPGLEIALEREHWTAQGFSEDVRARTDERGAWQLPWAEPGIQQLFVLRPGFLPERREFQVEEDRGEGYDIWLADAGALELEMFELQSGAPLPGVAVEVNGFVCLTGPDGRLTLPGSHDELPVDGLRLSLAAEGWCTTQGRVSAPPGVRLVRVPLARGASVSGVVVDGSGAPVQGALLRFSASGRLAPSLVLPGEFGLNAPRGPVQSGPDGRFEFRGLPPREGTAEVRATHPEHPPGRSEPLSLAHAGAHAEVRITLARGGSIHGRVTLDGEPAPLRVSWSAPDGAGRTRANDRGEYLCRGVPAGEVVIGARLEEEDDENPRDEDRVLFLEEGAAIECDLLLVSNLTVIAGVVRDTLGNGLSEVELQASAEHEESGASYEISGESASDGTFELRVPGDQGLSFELAAYSGPRYASVSEVSPGTRGIELVLPALSRVPLRVTDAVTHDPVQGFRLYWRESDGGTFERLYQGAQRFSGGPDGLFVAELPAGELDLAVSARDQGYAPEEIVGLELRPDQRSKTIEVELERGVLLELDVDLDPALGEEARSQFQRGRACLATEEQWRDRERGGDYFHQEVRNGQGLRMDGEGRVRLRAVAPGSYRFFNLPRSIEIHPDGLEVPAVERHEARIEVRPREPRGEAGR